MASIMMPIPPARTREPRADSPTTDAPVFGSASADVSVLGALGVGNGVELLGVGAGGVLVAGAVEVTGGDVVTGGVVPGGVVVAGGVVVTGGFVVAEVVVTGGVGFGCEYEVVWL